MNLPRLNDGLSEDVILICGQRFLFFVFNLYSRRAVQEGKEGFERRDSLQLHYPRQFSYSITQRIFIGLLGIDHCGCLNK